ncbi:MAG: hypothetical protein Q4C49_01050 [Bacillota bacterium]|nr:hypothetical protein [Bacillota bacterium]
MSKTKRNIRPEFTNGTYQDSHSEGSRSKTGVEHYEYMPKRKLSKLYSQHDIHYMGNEMNGHSPQKNSHSSKSGILRAKLKEEFAQELKEELEDNE